MDSGVDPHRHLVGILVGDALVHLEQVAVSLPDDVASEPLDCVGEVEIDAKAGFPDSPSLVADFLAARDANLAARCSELGTSLQ